MRFFYWGKDGGYESTVWGFWLAEVKSLFSIVLLKFEDGSREAFHNHAFNCFSWVVKGKLYEEHLDGKKEEHPASWMPFITRRDTFHQVSSKGNSWVLSFRGPWNRTWMEYLPDKEEYVVLREGRRVV